MRAIHVLAAIFNLIGSAYLFTSNGFLLLFQKNCEFCHIIAPPVIVFGLFLLNALITLKLRQANTSSAMKVLLLFNLLGILSASYYILNT